MGYIVFVQPEDVISVMYMDSDYKNIRTYTNAYIRISGNEVSIMTNDILGETTHLCDTIILYKPNVLQL